MNETPFFSVVIITYNRLPLLKRAIQSVKSQSENDWELLIVDNHSNDGTKDWVLSECDNDPRISLFLINNNNVIAKSRNLGIENAKGKYLAFLDSDDEWLPSKLEHCRKYLEQYPKLIGICHGLYYDDGSSRIAVDKGPFPDAVTRLLLIEGNKLTPSAFIVKSDCYKQVKGFSESPDIVTAEDYDVAIKLSRMGSIKYVSEILGVYYIHKSNMSSNLLRNYSALRKVVIKHINIQRKNSKSVQEKLFWLFIRGIWEIRLSRLRCKARFNKLIH